MSLTGSPVLSKLVMALVVSDRRSSELDQRSSELRQPRTPTLKLLPGQIIAAAVRARRVLGRSPEAGKASRGPRPRL
jgi:hypothetical protein